jgi:20S proteasome alpha/beta subunit
MAGVADRELDRAFTILAAFKTKYDELVSEYNNTVDAANASGEAPDLQTFMSRQQKLVESTRNALKKSLSPTSMAKLVAHVQYEKRNMKVAREDR